jgi:hypothetical protein
MANLRIIKAQKRHQEIQKRNKCATLSRTQIKIPLISKTLINAKKIIAQLKI